MRTNVFFILKIMMAGSLSGVGLVDAATVEVVRFSTADGIEIVGDFYKPAKSDRSVPGAILLPMYRSQRKAWKPLAERLQQAGFAVLAIDMRGHGESGGSQRESLRRRVRQREPTIFANMYRDVAAADGWLAKQHGVDPTRTAVVGASVGCSVAIDYGARDRSIDVVVALTPGLNYLGLDSQKPVVAYGDRPMWLFASEGERHATDSLAKLNPSIHKRIVGPGKTHGTRMFGAIEGIESEIVDVLKRELGGPSANPVVSLFGGDVYFESVGQLRKALPGKTGDLRWYSSAKEAEKRGLHAVP